MGFIVVGNPAIGVITFVPRGRSYNLRDATACIIIKLELLPLLVNIPYRLFINLGNLFSKLMPLLPNTNHPSKIVSIDEIYSSVLKYGPAYWTQSFPATHEFCGSSISSRTNLKIVSLLFIFLVVFY